MTRTHITAHKNVASIYSASSSNQISKEYYYHLVGEINRGTMVSAVCEVYNIIFGTSSYHLLTMC